MSDVFWVVVLLCVVGRRDAIIFERVRGEVDDGGRWCGW